MRAPIKKILSVLALFAATLASTNSFASAPEWHMINVNNSKQGDAHLLIDAGINTLIDAGSPLQGASHLVPYLRARGISKIHHLFISHPHTDHYGGVDALLDADVAIDNIYYNLPPENSDDSDYKRHNFITTINRSVSNGVTARNIAKGFSVALANSKIKVLHAQKARKINDQTLDINDYSLIIQWDAGEFRTLFTGDLNATLGTQLAKLEHMKADLLKVPHHGVTGIAPNAFFDTVAPSLAMFPSTRVLWNNPRGAQAKSWTLNRKIYFCHNGLNGNVVLRFDTSITVLSQTESANCPNGKLKIIAGPKINETNAAAVLPSINLLL